MGDAGATGSAATTPLVARSTTELRAGPLRVDLDGPDLRYVRLGEHELIRRLYVAVRDRSWNTIPPEVSNLVVHTQTNNFTVSFTCSHRQDEIDFSWQGTIAGSADGSG